jgi:hypothetical protein
MTIFLGLIILWMGCTRPVQEIKPEQPPQKEREASAKATDIPEWFLSPPEDPNYLYATATASGTDLGLTLDNAQLTAQNDIAGQIQVKVSTLFKRFREEVGLGEDAELTAVTAAVSKAVVSEAFSGARAVKKDVRREGSVTFRVYVLMEMPIGLTNAALVKQVKANKNMYAQFRASQAFKELEAEVGKYEQQSKEQG